MATNRIYEDGRNMRLTVTDPASPTSGDPVRIGEVTGVALTDEGDGGSDTTKTTVDLGPGVYDLSVAAVDDDGNSAVAVGDPIYYVDADTPKLSKKSNGGRFVGYAMETITSGSTATIEVLLVTGVTVPNLIQIGNVLTYLKFDKTNRRLVLFDSRAGGDSPRAMLIDVDVLAGNGYRQGGLQIDVDRADGEDFTWDGNPDAGLKIFVNNRAANADNEGAARGIDVSARNRGDNASWVNGGSINARNDNGSIAYQLIGIQTRLENYGTLNTEAIGLDINMSIENDTGSPAKHGIEVRNTDQSGMTVVDSVLKVSNTSTNGFGALLDLQELTAANGTLISTSGSAATSWAGRIRVVDASGAAAWINLYSTSNEA